MYGLKRWIGKLESILLHIFLTRSNWKANISSLYQIAFLSRGSNYIDQWLLVDGSWIFSSGIFWSDFHFVCIVVIIIEGMWEPM